VKRGDRVAIYLPLIPEAAISMLACARIGAIHSVVFGGFSPESLRDRINDAECKVLITADGGYRRGPGRSAQTQCRQGDRGMPIHQARGGGARRAGGEGDEAFAEMQEGRDHWWHRLMRTAKIGCEPEKMDAEDVLYILYTSGTTGKPKGIVHTTGRLPHGRHGHHEGRVRSARRRRLLVHRRRRVGDGAFVPGVRTARQRRDVRDVRGRTGLAGEGPVLGDLRATRGDDPVHGPTAIRAFMKWGAEHPAKHDLSRCGCSARWASRSTRKRGCGISEHIGGGRCPIVDTWWQTETGAIVISPLPGVTETKPGSATKPLPGYFAELLDSTGEVDAVGGGLLALTRPWPSMLRTIWGDPDRYVETYFTKWEGRPDLYFPGDGAKRDDDGYFWILGRVDDVLNVAGHRIGTMEVESALVEHPAVAEAAVVGKAHELKGQAVAAFVTLREGRNPSPALRDELREFVAEKIGAIARPDDILFSADLPKTRSGKIMRRLLRDVAEGRALGDTTTLADPNVVAALKTQYEDKEG
jgi:acetyl-CoA synthetase